MLASAKFARLESVYAVVRLLLRAFEFVARRLGASEHPNEGPDPVVGVGLVIVGILVMGIGGAANGHYLFNFGTGVAILGAILFVLAVTLSTYRDRALADAPKDEPVNKAR